MKFSDFPPEKVEVVTGEVVTVEDEEEEDDEDDTLEQDLSDALSLLQDCQQMLEILLDHKMYPTVNREISHHPYLMDELLRLAEETSVFVNQYEDEES